MEVTIDQALQKGIEAHKTGQVQEADRLYTAILQAQPKHPDANHNMGVLAVGVGKVEQALPFFKTALEANPATAQFWLSYIDALIKLERLADAKAVLDQARSKDAKGDGFDKLEQRLDGVEPSKTTVSQNQDPPQDQLQPLASLYSQGQLQKVLLEASQLLQKFPNSAILFNIIGASNNGLGQVDAAIEAYNKAIAIKPNYADAFNNMGITLKEHGKLEEAVEAYNKALVIKPDYAEAFNNMGNALKEQGKLEEAIEAYNKVIAIKPDYAEAYSNMGNALKEQGKLEEAVEAYNKALVIKPDHAEARSNLAILLFQSKLYEKAAELFSMDSSTKTQSQLLKCFYELGEKEKFSKQLDYLIERGENNAVIGSYLSRSKVSFGIKKDNPFCNKPLNYVSEIDLNKECDFQKIFVENAANVLSNDEVNHKSQGHLTNGIQTAGNIFTQVGSVTDQWQSIIHAELNKYKNYFCGSDEGLIRDWPSDYSIYGWLVSMKSGGELSAHIHDTGWITGSIYINVPPKSKKDSGNLVVTTNDKKHDKGKTKNRKSIDIVTGSLVLFPSSLLHYTIPFEANEDRIVLAFDVIPK
jgi:tetratricopeptide (TPR) repeat protein